MSGARTDDPTIASLQRCLRDVSGLLAIPSLSRGREPHDVLELVADAVARVLALDLVYARCGPEGALLETLRAPHGALAELRPLLEPRVLARHTTPVPIQLPRIGALTAMFLPFGLGPHAGGIVLGSRAPGFPSEGDRILMQTAASLAGSALDNAMLLQAARAADRRKDDFLALLGHELRNPLAPITTALPLVQPRDAVARRAHDVICRQVRHMSSLVDDLLDLSRIAKGKLELAHDDVDLAQLAREAADAAAPLFVERGIHFRAVIEGELWVRGDSRRLTQVLANLLGNAAKFAPSGSHVELDAHPVGDRAVCSVSDDGIGMRSEVLATIWDPFVQHERHEQRARGGLGLGLSLVKSIVTLHGGAVRAASDGLGCGSTFVLELPAIPARSAPRPSDAPGVSAPSVCVLVVDDNVDAADMMELLLSSAGCRVRVAYDAASALEIAGVAQPSIALLDLSLPGMDGCELARALRGLDGRVRLIALTGHGLERDRARTAEAGFDRHFVKPVEVSLLVSAITELARV